MSPQPDQKIRFRTTLLITLQFVSAAVFRRNGIVRKKQFVTCVPQIPKSDCTAYYAPAYSKNSGRALSVTPVRPSVRPYVPLSCPGHNSKTLWNIFVKLHSAIHHNKTMCHEQGRQLLHFWFLNYFPLT